MALSYNSPSENLLGQTLNEKWKVIKRLSRDPGDGKTARAVCYKAVSSDGQVAFIKVYDFRHVEIGGDTELLERMLAEFNNERRIHERCKEHRLNRVTKIIGNGFLTVSDFTVHYIICEWAPRSLRREHPPGENSVAVHIRLLALKKVASAIIQIHTAGIVHQDIKHSNIACVNQSIIKLTDLGVASCRHLPAPPHDDDILVGQPNLAPYEFTK